MPVTTLHLSSENSVRTSSGHHELRLEPGLQIPHDAKPTCYLHDLSFTNTVVNVSKTLYNNAEVTVTNPDTATPLSFLVPEGSYDLDTLERELAKQIRTHPTLADEFYNNTTGTFVARHGATFADDRVDDTAVDNAWSNALSIGEIISKIDNAADESTALSGSYIKPITLEPDATVNRIRIWMPYDSVEGEGLGMELFTDFLGFDFATQFGEMKGTVAKNTAWVDRARAISVNVPSVVSGVYSSNGKLGGSQLALVPITAPIGRAQAFTASVPIKLRAKLAGTVLDRVAFHLSSEDGDRIELQGERFDAIVVIEW